MRLSLNIWKGRCQVKIAYLKMVRENKVVGILASIQVHDNVKKIKFTKLYFTCGARGGVVVKALRYKPAGHGLDSRWRHWNLSVT